MNLLSRIIVGTGAVVLMCTAGNVQSQTKYKSITWEQFNANSPGLRQIGRLQSKHSKEIGSSKWSIGCETLDRNQANFQVYKQYVGELGAKYGRLQSGWAKCEQKKGVYDFAWLDSCVYGLKEQGVSPWICLSYANPIYKGHTDLDASVITEEPALQAWCRYVEATVTRYKDVVNEWEIWNEARTPSSTPEAYAELLIRTADAIRKVQPNATLFGMAIPGILKQYTVDVFEILKKRNRLDVMDYLTYHPYVPNPDAAYPDVVKLDSIVKSYNPKIKLYQGEVGCPSQLEWTHAIKNYPWTEYSQAKWLMRRMAGDMARDIRSNIFTIIDLKYFNMLQSFGLIRSSLLKDIIYKRPAYYGVQNMMGFFNGDLQAQGILQSATTDTRKPTVAGVKLGDMPAILVWYGDQIPTDELKWNPVKFSVKNVNFKDPVYIEMITGRVYEIEKEDWNNKGASVEFLRLPIWDSPIVIAERSKVTLK